ncbi:hypothetical protein DPEC_G00188020 [Dallia pectoralis]|uniref:Uncharacterized protein n=1 Tax=Dallia pectoralis TaxID=75939 RepID=A0ACC2GBU5_DALPE|nr:hypothetical protein DPEC_G00188020 [Dallia pectoralis]
MQHNRQLAHIFESARICDSICGRENISIKPPACTQLQPRVPDMAMSSYEVAEIRTSCIFYTKSSVFLFWTCREVSCKMTKKMRDWRKRQKVLNLFLQGSDTDDRPRHLPPMTDLGMMQWQRIED